MARPTNPIRTRVLLSEISAPTESILIPRGISYERLEDEALGEFGHIYHREHFAVHFHVSQDDFKGEFCRAELRPRFWNDDNYLSDEMTTDGTLHIWAHFKRKPPGMLGVRAELTEDSVEPLEISRAQYGRQADSINRGAHGLRPAPASRSQYQAESPSPSPIVNEPKAIPVYYPDVHPALPHDATPENFARDYEMAQNDDTVDEFNVSGMRMADRSVKSRRSIATARLMRGRYGMMASKPCNSCRENGKNCRVLHPVLYSQAWSKVNKTWNSSKYGARACAECIAIGKSCNAQWLHSSAVQAQVPPKAVSEFGILA